MADEICAMPNCKRKVDIIYYTRGLCDKCWTKWSEKEPAALKKALNIKASQEVQQESQQSPPQSPSQPSDPPTTS